MNSCIPDSCNLGSETKVARGVAKSKRGLTFNPVIGSRSYNNIADKLYVIYKFDKYINSSIYDYGTAIMLAPNTTYKKEFEITESKTISFEETVHNELKLDTSIAVDAGINVFDLAKIGVSADTEIESKVSLTTKTNETVSYTKGEKESFTITNNSNETKNYWLQLRASFECYVVQIYDVLYNVTERVEGRFLGKSTTYIYSSYAFKLSEQYATLKYIPRSDSRGFYEVELNDRGQYVCSHQSDNAVNIN